MMCPLAEAEAIRVPSGLTAMAPTSVSWAGITRSIDLSTTEGYRESKQKNTLLTVIEYFQRSFLLSWETNDLGNWLLSRRQSAEPLWVREGVDLLYELQSDEIEDEGLLV